MSTLAWDGKTLATDRCKTDAGMQTSTQKLFYESGTLGYAILGWTDGAFEVLDWLRDGAQGKVPDSYRVIEDSKESVVFRLRLDIDGPVLERLRTYGAWELCQPFYAAGSGRDFALGAMSHGASAVEAIQTANHLDAYSNFGVDSIVWDAGRLQFKRGDF